MTAKRPTFRLTIRKAADLSGSERLITLTGQIAVFACKLIEAGGDGVTVRDFPTGWRISDLVLRLRQRHGLIIRTAEEANTGIFAGHHARYVMLSPVSIDRDETQGAAA
ncbi:winged helix domain-containing protein [Microbaculum marinisediminis]|uniref:Winged helix domain-containing protein n=1 Tax=Microbaculum marinisediminis TaxID=2931392 RepID=A0AAW5QV55_9HYPH|nr:hypothetical protein [Microbaculum sp. A6E488]MCT8970872.1 hypothetical protein [Microbaculum sp. A6E488]